MDIRTLFIAQAVLLLTYTFALVLVARSQPGLKGVRWIAWAFACNTLGTFWGGFWGGPFDAWAMASGGMTSTVHGSHFNSLVIVLADLLVLGAYVLFRGGLAEFLEQDPRHAAIDLPVLVLACVGFVWFAVAQPNGNARDFVFTLTTGMVSASCGVMLLRHRPKGIRDSVNVMTGIFAVVVFVSLVRLVSIVVLGAPLLKFMHPPDQASTILVRMIATFSVAFCFVWMATERLRNSLEEMAQTDYLTGVLNRRSLRMYAEREIARCRRAQQPLSVLVVDVDHFKIINDTYGHFAGDEALRQVAEALHKELRRADLLARYGGEEFVIVLSDVTGEAAHRLAERLRAKLEGMRIAAPETHFRLTASFGVAQLEDGSESWETLVARADRALYAAKQAGRNRAMIASAS